MSTSVLEIPRLDNQPAITTREELKSVTGDNSDPQFTEDELESLHRDDAMASSGIAIILGCAFTVLLVLTIGVTVWTITVTA